MQAAYTINGYTIGSEVSRGSQGTVKLCSHKDFPNVQLCVKIIQNTEISYNLEVREIQILKRLRQFNNGHLIKVFDIFEGGNQYFVIMELCLDGTLENKIQQQKQPFSASHILNFISQFVDGYQVLHANDIFHRDIKPSNIFCGKENSFIIGDLGSSRVISYDEKIEYTRNGTQAYMSPQMILGNNFTAKTDMYSLGLIIYEMIFLCLPYKKTRIADIETFSKKLQVSPLNLKIQLQGTNEQIQEIQLLVNSLITFDEKKRMGFLELINRVQKLKVYQDFVVENKIMFQSKYKVEFNNSISSHLILMQRKIDIARFVQQLFELMLNEKLMILSQIEYFCFISVLFGYIFYQYTNMAAIYENQPDKLNQHIKKDNFKNLFKEFKNQQTIVQNQQYEKCSKFLKERNQQSKDVLIELCQLFEKTISLINNDNNFIKDNQLNQFKLFINEIKNQKPDYQLLLKYTEIIYHQCIKKHCIKLSQSKLTELTKKFLANVSVLFELEIDFPSNDLSIEQTNFPVLIEMTKDATERVNKKKDQLLK